MASAYHWEARRRQMALDRRRHYQLQQELKNKAIDSDLEEQRYCMGLEPYQRYHSPSPEARYPYGNLSPEPSHRNSGLYAPDDTPEDLRGNYIFPEHRGVSQCLCQCQCQCHYQGQGSHYQRAYDQDDEEDQEQGQSKRERGRDRGREDRDLCKSHRPSKSQVRNREQGHYQNGKGSHHHKSHLGGHHSHQQAATPRPQEYKHNLCFVPHCYLHFSGAPVTENHRHPKRGKRYTAMEYVQQW
ncbi:coiled-coil domain-containing protein 200 isoform X3 [Monodelphis domestica]|uniref:coiled-coil domain-containing protein 200 isoform X3 n=1 Tax=Monodelphis domestica TaxID=13616 RepID=UPI0024E23199|nr:coiled-coil domain-containing protein 200 isoform X3 [Monodelphis domestica]